jgi:hypothetical protein
MTLIVHRDDGKGFIVSADEKLTAFLELERATRESLGHRGNKNDSKQFSS